MRRRILKREIEAGGGEGRKKLSLVFEEKSNEASRNSSDEINEKYYEDI